MVGFRDHVVGNGILAVAAMDVGGRAQDVELARGLFRIGHERREQRPRGRELRQQERDARLLRHLAIVRARTGLEQFGQDPLMHVRVLPQVDAGEMEAEHFDCAPQHAQASARDHRRPLETSDR